MKNEKLIQNTADLAASSLLSPEEAQKLAPVISSHALRITPVMAELIRKNPDGPVARQFIPDIQELTILPHEQTDPIGDQAHSPVSGLVHRYPDRVLFKIIHQCAVYCRFCFRREMVGKPELSILPDHAIDQAIRYIAGHETIREVVFSGGDPLLVSPRRLSRVLKALALIPHLDVLRFHTRIPVADPERVQDNLLQALRSSQKATFIALHANHADEFTPQAEKACSLLIDAGFPMLGQSVLLKGINNSPEALEALMRSFIRLRIKPYYLHHPDLAPGTGHFRLSIKEGQQLVQNLRGRISGLCQPHYMLDIPGGFGKTPLATCGITENPETGSWIARDFNGVDHDYQDS